MNDLTEVYAALQKADAAGDTAGAQQLADYIRGQSPSAPAGASPASPASQPFSLHRFLFGDTTLGQQLAAPFQAAGSLATGLLAPAAAAAQNLIQGKTSPADYAQARSEWQYTPTNPAAQTDINALTYLPRKILGPVVNYGAEQLARTGLLSKLQGQDVLNMGLAGLSGLRFGGAAEAPAALTPAAETLNAGFKLTPTQVGDSPLGSTLEGFSGSAKLERGLSRGNAPIVDAKALAEAGSAGIEPEDFAAAREAPLAVYKAARGAGQVPLSPADFSAVKAPGTLKDPGVEALREHFQGMEQMDANDLVSDLIRLKAEGHAQSNAPYYQVAERTLGQAKLKAASGLEDALDRHLDGMDQAPISIDDLRQARTQLAKINDVETSVRGSNISAAALSRKSNLTGGLADIQHGYQNFPRSFQDVSKIRDSAPVNYGDLLLGALGALRHPVLAGAAIARPAARAFLSSDAYQGSLAPALSSASAPNGLSGLAALPALNQQTQDYLLR